MKRALTIALYVIIYIIVFALIQMLCALLLTPLHLSTAATLILATAASSIITIVVFILTHWAAMGLRFIYCNTTALFLWLILLALALILPLQYFEELLSLDLPEDYAETFSIIINNQWGYIIVGILAPISEEIVFRGAILRKLLEMKNHTWAAIVLSAALFGVIHGNLAQFTHAFIIGLLLGWLYIRTRSILPCLLIHWVNNTIAVAVVRCFPESADAHLADLFSNNLPLLYILIAVSALLALFALWMVARSLRHISPN